MKNGKLADMINGLYKDRFEKNMLNKTIPLVKDRITKLTDYSELAEFFFEKPEIDKKLFGENSNVHLESALKVMANINDWKLDNINESLMSEIKKQNFKTGDFFMSLRVAITGKKFTPPINESMEILGKEETLERIKKAISKA